MSIKLLLVGLVMLATVKSRDDIPPAMRAEIETLCGLTYEVRLDRLAAYGDEYRAELLKWGRVWVELSPPGEPRSSVHDEFLFHLGDEEIMARGAAQFARGDYGWAQIFIYGRNPAVIPLLAPTMNDDKLIDPSDPHVDPPYAATETIVIVLQHAPQFSPDVRAWALNAKAMGDSPQERAIMREWWRKNEKAFAKRDYAAVKPGTTLEATKPPENTEPSEPAREPTQIDTLPLAVPKEASVVVATTPSDSPQLWVLVAGATATVALLVGLAVFWKRRV